MSTTQMKSRLPAVGIVGAGRVGSVFAARLAAAGFPIMGIAARSHASKLRAQTLVPHVDVLAPSEIAERADVLILAVPDDQLETIATELAPWSRPGQIVIHTSGRHGVAVLGVMSGARRIAMHPAMSFTGTSVDLDRTCVFGVTAADSEHEIAEELVAALGGTALWIAEADRVRYHAALAFGANNITTIVGQAMDLLRSIGADNPADILGPLLEATLDNTLHYGDAALTGPVARGDVGTVRAHLDAIATDASLSETYVALARATARRAARPEIEAALESAKDRA